MSQAQIDSARRNLYGSGATAIYTLSSDKRFCYCMYIPENSDRDMRPLDLLVVVHGTNRGVTEFRDAFASFAERNRTVILSPLFPVGVAGDGNVDGYKYLVEGDIRYDKVLLDMVEEASISTGCRSDRFSLFGFSGGGHFAHRFLFVHPERLKSVVVGAPGQVTLPDEREEWWIGVGDIEQLFGKTFDVGALRKVAVQALAGKDDIETWEITHQPHSRYWSPQADKAGTNRVERILSLASSLRELGVETEVSLVPDAEHEFEKILPFAQEFLGRTVRND